MSIAIEVNKRMSSMMSSMIMSVASQVIECCASKYGFSKEEALSSLNLSSISSNKKEKKSKKSKKPKASFPLPFSGEHSELCCQALRQNNGLYTQCQGTIKNENQYCKSCHLLSEKSSNGIPEYGTISMRLASEPYDYIDPKGRKPTHYTKVMKKYNLTNDQVLEEAAKFGMNINEVHFVTPEETKRGRPAKEPKEPKETKAVKGRPKNSKKVVELASDEEDLFATLVAESSNEEAEKEDEKAAKLAAKETEKAAKKAALEKEKAAKLAEKETEKAAKQAAKEAEKESKKAAIEKEKADKLAAKLAAKKTKNVQAEEQEQEETYKKITGPDNKKYLRSQQTNIVYDFDEYTKSETLVPVGKWIVDSKTLIFTKDDNSDSELSDDEVEDDEVEEE